MNKISKVICNIAKEHIHGGYVARLVIQKENGDQESTAIGTWPNIMVAADKMTDVISSILEENDLTEDDVELLCTGVE